MYLTLNFIIKMSMFLAIVMTTVTIKTHCIAIRTTLVGQLKM